MKKALLIYNPHSGHRDTVERLDYIVKRFMERNIMIIPFRLDKNNKIQLTVLLKTENYKFAVVSGGDGTISTTADTFLNHNFSLPLGIIPAGTCNDLARTLSIPGKLGDCIDVILEGNTVKIDTGLINDTRYFINSLAAGTFAEISYSTSGTMKRSMGSLAYYMNALKEIASIKPFNLRVEVDNCIVNEKAMLFIILNGSCVAGFKNVNKSADISDGIMNIVIIKKCSHLELAGMLLKFFKNEILNDKNVISVSGRKCYIEFTEKLHTSVDGEKFTGLPVSVKFLEKNLNIFTPLMKG